MCLQNLLEYFQMCMMPHNTKAKLFITNKRDPQAPQALH